MPVVVREASPEDAAAIARVQISSWRAAYRGIVPDAFLEGMDAGQRAERWREGLTARPHGQIVYLAELDDAVGFGAVGACRDPGAAAGVGELFAIYVAPERWRQGIGHALHAACLDGLRSGGFGEARLWVLDANRQARSFYEQLGWSWDGAMQYHAFGDEALPIVRYRRELEQDSTAVTIRSAVPGEGERLREIAQAAKGQWGYDPDRVRDWARGLDLSDQCLGTGEVYVADIGGCTVGWAEIVPPTRGSCVLDHLWVAPAWAGRKVGSALFAFAAERAAQLRARSMVWEAEPHAIEFYTRMGGHLAGSTVSEWGRELPLMAIDLDLDRRA